MPPLAWGANEQMVDLIGLARVPIVGLGEEEVSDLAELEPDPITRIDLLKPERQRRLGEHDLGKSVPVVKVEGASCLGLNLN